MTTDMSENCRRCDITSLPVSEIYVVCSSKVNRNLEKRQPGKLNLAHWFTTANRILKFYISTSDPSNELLTLVVFILRVDAPSWFQIKVHHSIKGDARHLWHLSSSSCYLPKKYRDIIEIVIFVNAYFAAPENMLTDERCHMRTLSVRESSRQEKFTQLEMVFATTAVNFGATDYVDHIDWQAFYVTPSTILRHVSCHELLKMIKDDVPMNRWDFIKFLSHTQAVDRILKLVTEASRKTVGPQNRDEFIRTTLESRKHTSKFESRKIINNSSFVI
ncbi:hypothetical protein AVEN_173865-1 [Araneus ventricosus]|uniref:Uncharacterized protein n=1 Tax=Araneus ventricosus TaxID=182803 RepID=A0A4Y2I105_ARAVE|nr:hypothetical protein AVEN_173865-1 [Araneus ventricosus]